MAFLARMEIDGAQRLPNLSPAQLRRETATFTPLEWSVIRLSRGDHLWSVNPTSFQRLVNALLARQANRLANDRLEALRRIAVISRRFGFEAPAEAVGAFLAAGFSVEQYELLVSSVRRSERSPAVGQKR